jgi:hypothetical protein
MKIAVEFDSLEEFEAFRTSGKKTRSGKRGEEGDDAPTTGSAPTPLMPPAGGVPGGALAPGQTQMLAPGVSGFSPGNLGGVFPAAGAQIAPEVAALVQRIIVKLDSAIASGQPADQALMWFRNQCGPDAANYTMDQIKQHGLPKLQQTQLDAIAKMMNA